MLLTLQIPGSTPKQVELLTKVEKATWGTIAEMEERQKYSTQYYTDLGDDLFIWKMPGFDLDEKSLDDMMKKVGQHKSLIIDLRGNGGGYEKRSNIY